MVRNLRLGFAAFFALLAVLVDFASRFLSVVTDGALIVVAVFILLPLLRKPKQKQMQ